eukprot:COSAG03_NODE_110_length_12523_cov_61.863731_9_plen_95_part_00
MEGPTPIASYTRIYDGITSVLHRDHPQLVFSAMCWAGIDPASTEYFMNVSNHAAGTSWPPAYVTFHIYMGPGDMFGGVPSVGDSAGPVAQVNLR